VKVTYERVSYFLMFCFFKLELSLYDPQFKRPTYCQQRL